MLEGNATAGIRPAWLALRALALAAFAAAWLRAGAAPSEISVDLRFTASECVEGERVRAVVDVRNSSPSRIRVGYPDAKDHLFVEVFRAHDMMHLDRVGKRPFVSRFTLDANEGQKLEVFLADHYALTEPRRYLARPVLVHGGVRYEGQYRAFDIVPGMKISGALQMFANKEGLGREFELVHWARKGTEHIFLKSQDGVGGRRWETRDLGAMMKLTKPTISILPSGKVVVLHRFNPDSFIRSEFWSLPDTLEFVSRELVSDPETAGQARVQELYEDAGGVQPVSRSWWKFW